MRKFVFAAIAAISMIGFTSCTDETAENDDPYIQATDKDTPPPGSGGNGNG